MSKDSINEMEQIQKGLEEFLRQEVEGYSDDIRYDDRIEKERNKDGNYGSPDQIGEPVRPAPVRRAGEPERSAVRATPNQLREGAVRSGTRRSQEAFDKISPDRTADVAVRNSGMKKADTRNQLKRNRKTVSDTLNEADGEMTVKKIKRGEIKALESESRKEGSKKRSSKNGESKKRDSKNGESEKRDSKYGGSKKRGSKNGESEKRDSKYGESKKRDSKYGEGGKRDGKNGESKKKDSKYGDGKKEGSKIGNSRDGGNKKPVRKKSGFKKFFIIIMLLAVLIGAGWYALVGIIYGKMKYEEIASLTNAPMKEDGVINILLIGNDSRSQGEDGRSDAMILLSVSSRTKTIHMTSLLRDIYVEIPGYKGNRLNAAYSYGGPELLMETIEKNLDISINRYVLVNFQAFANLVDAVGGVELELTSQEVEYINGYLVEYNILEGRPEGTDYLDTTLSGMVHLNGPQALAYSRNRYLGTDFGRTERQRKILSAVIDRLPGAVIKNPAGLMDGLLPNLTTNLTSGECLSLSLQAGKLLTYDLIQGSIPVEGSYSNANIRGMAVLQIDFDKNKEYIRSNIYGE